LARHQKKALQEGRTIIFIDESGISQRPHRVRTWSPRGETLVLPYNFNWDTLSAVAGITFYSFYFRLYQGTVKSAEVVDFLQALLRHLPGSMFDRLGSIVRPPESDHPRLHGWAGPNVMGRIPARLCTGTQPSRVHLGLVEAARATQCLPERLLGPGADSAPDPQKDTSPSRLITAFWHQAELSF